MVAGNSTRKGNLRLVPALTPTESMRLSVQSGKRLAELLEHRADLLRSKRQFDTDAENSTADFVYLNETYTDLAKRLHVVEGEIDDWLRGEL